MCEVAEHEATPNANITSITTRTRNRYHQRIASTNIEAALLTVKLQHW